MPKERLPAIADKVVSNESASWRKMGWRNRQNKDVGGNEEEIPSVDNFRGNKIEAKKG